MKIRETLDKAAMRGVPDWLVNDTPSHDGSAIRDEWARLAAREDADAGLRRVASGMLQLRSQRPTRPLLGRANAKALRWVESAVNRSRLAKQLREATTRIPLRHRALLVANALAWKAVAAVLVLALKSGLFTAADGMVRTMDRMGQIHNDRHIGPMI